MSMTAAKKTKIDLLGLKMAKSLQRDILYKRGFAHNDEEICIFFFLLHVEIKLNIWAEALSIFGKQCQTAARIGRKFFLLL